MKADKVVTLTEEELPTPNNQSSQSMRARFDDFHMRRRKAKMALRFSCITDIAMHIRELSDPAELWEALQTMFDNTATHLGRSAIVTKFHNAQPSVTESIVSYITHLQAFRRQLVGTPEAISEQTFRAHIYRYVLDYLKMTVAILKRTGTLTIEDITIALKETEA